MDLHSFFSDNFYVLLALLILWWDDLPEVFDFLFDFVAGLALIVVAIIIAIGFVPWKVVSGTLKILLFAFLMLFPFFREIVKQEILMQRRKRDEFGLELEGSHYDAVNKTFKNPFKTNPDRPY